MIKVPATVAGLPANEELTARGVNVNVTRLFSVNRYEQVIDAFVAGLERRLAAGRRVDAIASVASFFVSRVDAKADALLPADSPLRGQIAVANARLAYGRYRRHFADERWRALRDAGANRQPAAALVGQHGDEGPGLLRRSLRREADRARRDQHDADDHAGSVSPIGEIRPMHDEDEPRAEEILRQAHAAGIDLPLLPAQLTDDGVRAFCDSYEQLLSCIRTRLSACARPPRRTGVAQRRWRRRVWRRSRPDLLRRVLEPVLHLLRHY